MARASSAIAIEELEVVDCDFHVTERQEDVLSYISDPFRSMLLGHREEGGLPIGSFFPSSGVLTPMHTGKTEARTCLTRDDVREGKSMLSVDTVLVTPTRGLYLNCMHHDDLAVAMAAAYNDWARETVYDADDGIYGTILVGTQKPKKAADEIRRLASADEIVSAFVPTGGVHPLLGAEEYDPIYEACEDAGLPILLHTAGGSMPFDFPFHFSGSDRYMTMHSVLHPMTQMSHLSDMIVRGVPARFPDLDFVFQESGLGWVPYMMKRLDHEYAEKREDAPALEKPPSEYIDDQFYFTSQPLEGTDDPEYVGQMVKFLGPDNFMFSSDYPHPDFDHSSELLGILAAEFDEDEIAGIYGETAKGLFGV